MRDLIDEAADLMTSEGRDGLLQVVMAIMRRAIGVRAVHHEHVGQDVVYEVLPDVQAARLILEHRFGKPKESIEVSTAEDKFTGLPQVVMMPPMNWGKRREQTGGN